MNTTCVVQIAPSAIRAAANNEIEGLFFECSTMNGRRHYTLKSAISDSYLQDMRNSVFSLFRKQIRGAELKNILTLASSRPTGPALSNSIVDILARDAEVQNFTEYLQLGNTSPLSSGKKKFQRGIKKLASLNHVSPLVGVGGARANGTPLKSLDLTYASEMSNEGHYYTGSLKEARKVWLRTKGNVPFEKWLTAHPQYLDQDYKVKYLNAKEREKYEVTFQNGRLVRNGKPFSTKNETTAFSGDGTAIFVLSNDKKFYSGSHIVGQFHHSSFLSGKPVSAAGEIQSDKNGKIIKVSAKSGHYKPTIEQNLTMLRTLKENGVDLSSVIFEEVSHKVFCTYDSAQSYLDSKGTVLPSKIHNDDGATIKVLPDPCGIIELEEEQTHPISNLDQHFFHFATLKILKSREISLNQLQFYTTKLNDIRSCEDYYLFLERANNDTIPYQGSYDENNWKAQTASVKRKRSSAFNKVKAVVGKGRLGMDVTGLNSIYHLEAFHPNHPYGRSVFTEITQKWKESNSPLSLMDYLEENQALKAEFDNVEETIYLDAEERLAFQVEIRDGLMYQNGNLLTSDADLCFVLGPDDKLYAAPHRRGIKGVKKGFNHSSFFSGKPIKAGGMFPKGSIVDGKIVGNITNKTGHYGKSPLLSEKDPQNLAGDTGTFTMGPKEYLRLEKFFNKHAVSLNDVRIADVSGESYEQTPSMANYLAKAKALEAEPYFHHCNLKAAQHRLNTLSPIGSYLVHPGVENDYNIVIKTSYDQVAIFRINVTPDGFKFHNNTSGETFASIELLLQTLDTAPLTLRPFPLK